MYADVKYRTAYKRRENFMIKIVMRDANVLFLKEKFKRDFLVESLYAIKLYTWSSHDEKDPCVIIWFYFDRTTYLKMRHCESMMRAINGLLI